MKYKSNGKILLTSEYLVLDGAQALALPSKFSQSLEVKETKNINQISWTSYDFDGKKWFDDLFAISKDKFIYEKRKNKFSDKMVNIVISDDVVILFAKTSKTHVFVWKNRLKR